MKGSPGAKRTAAEKRGRAGETLAALYLRLEGFRILAQRVRTPVGEIDLIAEKYGIVVFVEVKARRQANAALSAVTLHAWNRVARATDHWMAEHPRYTEHGWRYDISAIAPSRLPVHLRHAWRPGMA